MAVDFPGGMRCPMCVRAVTYLSWTRVTSALWMHLSSSHAQSWMPELYNPLSLKNLKRKVKEKGGESSPLSEVKSQQPLLSRVSCDTLVVSDTASC